MRAFLLASALLATAAVAEDQQWGGDGSGAGYSGGDGHSSQYTGRVTYGTPKVTYSAQATYSAPKAQDKDCQVGSWGPWGDCQAQCGVGKKYRKRPVVAHHEGNGKLCTEVAIVVSRKCQGTQCPKDCDYTWGEWGACDKSCGSGTTYRSAKVAYQPVYGGQPCPGKQAGHCNTDYCPVNCAYGWGNWGDCSKECGGGLQYKKMRITQKRGYGGKSCPDKQEQMRVCNSNYCPVNCAYDWGDWSSCSATCGSGVMYRSPKVTTKSAYGGTYCPSKQSKSCFKKYCPVDCAYKWGPWSGCSKTCGGGYSTRSPVASVKGAYGGAACPPAQSKVCSTDYCPVDCEYEWGVWGECDKSCGGGSQYKRAVVSVKNAYGGTPCPPDQKGYCNSDYCTVDCDYEWGDWSECDKSCGGGHKSRSPKVAVKAAYGGQPCPEPKSDYCNTDYCPVDCGYEWGEWSDCSASCGGGTRHKKAIRNQLSGYGGKKCPETQDEACGTDYCPVDCNYEWGDWSQCDKSCGGGSKYRSPDIKYNGDYGGIPCPKSGQRAPCGTDYCSVDCQYEWGNWGDCDKSCAGGTAYRKMVVSQQPGYGGKKCPSPEDSKSCNSDYCPIDCDYSDFGDWSECSKPCGYGGEVHRERKVKQQQMYGGAGCPHMYEEKDCYYGECAVDCTYDWGDWADCSVTCGGAKTYRKPVIQTKPKNGVDRQYKSCPEEEYKECGNYPCPIDCSVSDYGAWASCSEKCGKGYSESTREVVVKPQYGGVDCPELYKKKDCNYGPCAIDCNEDYGEWGTCPVSCGGGYVKRSPVVKQKAQYGGEPCVYKEQKKACGTDYCPYAYPKLRLYLRPKGYSAPAYGKSGPHMGPGVAAASPSLNSDGGLTHYHYPALSVDGALSSRNAHTSSSTGVVVGVVLGVVGVIAMAVVVVARRRTQTKEVQRQSAGTAPLTPSVGVPAPASL